MYFEVRGGLGNPNVCIEVGDWESGATPTPGDS